MRYNKVTSYLGQVGNKRNITTNGHSIRKEFWPSPLLFGGYSGTRRFPWCSPSLDGPNKAYSWMTSVNSEYIFRQVQLVPETCIPIIYPLYTWYIPIVYLIYTHCIPIIYPSSSIQDWMGLKLTSRPSTTWYRMFWSKYRNQLPYSQGNRNWSWKFVPSPVMVIY